MTDNNEKLIQQNIRFRLKVKRGIHLLIISFVTLLVGWQFLDIFIWKNADNLFISFVKYCMADTIFKDENLPQTVAEVGIKIVSILSALVDFILLRIFCSEECIKKYKSKIREKLLS